MPSPTNMPCLTTSLTNIPPPDHTSPTTTPIAPTPTAPAIPSHLLPAPDVPVSFGTPVPPLPVVAPTVPVPVVVVEVSASAGKCSNPAVIVNVSPLAQSHPLAAAIVSTLSPLLPPGTVSPSSRLVHTIWTASTLQSFEIVLHLISITTTFKGRRGQTSLHYSPSTSR